MQPSNAEIAHREAERCAALMAGDTEKLASMLSDDLVHIHLNGKADTRQAYLEGVRSKYRFKYIERGELNIRSYGEFAVMTGPLSQKIEIVDSGETIDVDAVTTQIWIRKDEAWLLNTCHNATIPR